MLVRKKISIAIASACMAVSLSSFAAENAPTVERLWEIVQRQQLELEALKAELESTRTETRTVQVQSLENSERIEAVGEVIDQPRSLGSSWADRTTIGGYGEVLYNDQTSASSTRELDVQRFVIFTNHEFNERVRFFSELEVEHSYAADDARAPGVVELEQAFIEWDYARNHRVAAGMYLAPLGIMNETHEPDTFYGVERNRVESRIIPTTYRVNGIKFSGQTNLGFSYDLGIHEGLFFESGNGGELAIRDSRQSGARAEMDNPAYTGRLRYTGIPGLELGMAVQYQTDMTQSGSARGNTGRDGVIDMLGNPVDGISGILSEAHVAYQGNNWGLKALYAQWNIDNKIESVANNDLSNNGLGRDRQTGYYLQPSYQFTPKTGAFLRYEHTDERASSNIGAAKDSANNRIIAGLNYWLATNVVLKLDYQFENDEKERDLDGLNLGVGWQF